MNVRSEPLAYRFSFSPVTGLFNGLTRNLKDTHSTDKEPPFNQHARTCWDFEKKEWRLIDRQDYWNSLGKYNDILNYESKYLKKKKNMITINQQILSDTLYGIEIKESDIKNMLQNLTSKLTQLSQILDRHQSFHKNYADTLHTINKNYTEIRFDRMESNLKANFILLQNSLRPWYQRLWLWLF